VNSALAKSGSDVVYEYDFLKDITVPTSQDDELGVIEKFRVLFEKIIQENPKLTTDLNLRQSITIYMFRRVTDKMTHAQVAKILGSSGQRLDESQKEKDSFSLYTWHGTDVSDLYVFFKNDGVSHKMSLGYN
jgi:hypothetical protein